jgi:flagellar biosynthesis/type III secretory pathway chaperone
MKTIRQAAKVLNVTADAIYKRIKTNADLLDGHIIKSGNIKHIDDEGLKILADLMNLSQGNKQQEATANLTRLQWEYERLTDDVRRLEAENKELKAELRRERENNLKKDVILQSTIEQMNSTNKLLLGDGRPTFWQRLRGRG